MYLKYFKFSEFDSPDKPESGKDMDGTFIQLLDKARGIANIPFRITSGYRTEEWNKKVGGRVGSSHLKGLAADIFYTNNRERFLIMSALLEVGFTRIGLGRNFIHCDLDFDKDLGVIWTYDY
ncbi:MAG: peptidase M15 [Pusillimonas sp.]|jgi:uncharacterized protein YcbK (DUF882 family)|nr:peptidase M15 [Pusillimonas sp.]